MKPSALLTLSGLRRRFPASLALCVGLCFGGLTAASAQNIKLGIVDMNKVINGYYKTKDAEAKLNDAREGAKKELDERMESHRQLLDEINTLNKDIDNAALSASAKADRNKKRDDKIAQVRALEQEIQDFKTSRERGLQEQLMRLRNQVVEEIMAVINARVKADNFDLVLDKGGLSSLGIPVVLHANDKLDFSDDLISQLNKNRPAAATPSGATPLPPAAGRK